MVAIAHLDIITTNITKGEKSHSVALRIRILDETYDGQQVDK